MKPKRTLSYKTLYLVKTFSVVFKTMNIMFKQKKRKVIKHLPFVNKLYNVDF